MIKSGLLLGALVLVLAACMSTEPDPDATQVDDFAQYLSWSKVNAQTVSGDATGVLGNAHGGPRGFREVYINATGKPTSDGQAALPYPVGTTLVKETHSAQNEAKGRLTDLTIMVKRGAGYDSANGDWEYLMVTPAMRIRSQGRIGMCINCHAAAITDDYVFTSNR